MKYSKKQLAILKRLGLDEYAHTFERFAEFAKDKSEENPSIDELAQIIADSLTPKR